MLTEKLIQTLLWKRLAREINPLTAVPNCYYASDCEADLLVVKSSLFISEYEIKLSRSDLLADKKKQVVYRRFKASERGWRAAGLSHPPWKKPKLEALQEGLLKPNYFWYVVQKGQWQEQDIPLWAGLVEVEYLPQSGGTRLTVLRKPDRLHSEKIDPKFLNKLHRKLYFRYWRDRANGS